MKAFVTSIGESTTELCVWSLERQGFDVELILNPETTLAHKLEEIYNLADDNFLRVDADIVVTNKVKLLDLPKDIWWVQAQCFDMHAQDIIYGGIQMISKEALPALRKHIINQQSAERPETAMYRLEEFYKPRRCQSVDLICGIHSFGKQDMQRIQATKARRGQSANYDFELANKMQEFYK